MSYMLYLISWYLVGLLLFPVALFINHSFFSESNYLRLVIFWLAWCSTISIITYKDYINKLKLIPVEFRKKAYTVFQCSNLSLKLSFKDSYNICLNSLNLIGNYELLVNDYSNGLIEAVGIRKLKYSGEIVTFIIKEASLKSTDIRLYSRPQWNLTLYDSLRNLRNIVNIITYIKDYESSNFMGTNS
jgi:hypothetical protein